MADANQKRSRFQALTPGKKVQFVIASVLTASLIVGLPVFAWFSRQRQIAELQQIREPDLLYITAANAEDVKFFDLSTIRVKDSNNNAISEPEYYPFAVAGKYVSKFTLQMAHTTNNPFIYNIYEGTAYTTRAAAETAAGQNGVVLEYKLNGEWSTLAENGVILTGEPKPIAKSEQQTTIYIVKGSLLNGSYLNDTTAADGRTIADTTYHAKSYDDYSYSNIVRFEEPLYWQCTGIQSLPAGSAFVGDPFMKTFVLEISWTAEDVAAGRINNDKETDIVYLSAFRK